MGHMQNDITAKQYGWSVETSDCGTCFVPGDVVTVPGYLKPGEQIDSDDTVFESLSELLADYVEGRKIESIEVCKGYFARLSAPGYLDCTEWTCYPTIKEARSALSDI